MAQLYKFFNSTVNDPRTYQAQDFANYFGSVLSTGLIHTDEIPGMETSVETGTLQTYVSPGKAIMQGHLYENTADEYLEHSIPESTYDRIDRIVLRLDLRNAERNILLHILEGDPSNNPTPPELQRDNFIYELSLAQIRVRANTSSLESDDLIDERLDEELCGLVNSMLTVPTSQFLSEWQTFMDDIQSQSPVPQSEFDAHLAHTVKYQNETNFVEYVRSQLNFDRMSLNITNNANMKEFDLTLSAEQQLYVRYNFKKGDDFIYLSGVYAKENTTTINNTIYEITDFNKTGSWVNATGGKVEYTTEVGAKTTMVFTTSGIGRIYSNHYCDNRGGLFKVTLDGVETKTISLYSPTIIDSKKFHIFSDVPAGEHTIVFEFLGDDPANVPDGEVSRGWLTSLSKVFLSVTEKTQTQGTEKPLMSNGSIKEFAFSVKPANGTKAEWMPQHGGLPTMFNESEPILILDGAKYGFDDLEQGWEYEIKSFGFIQNLYGRNPETASTNLLKMNITRTINLDGVLTVTGKMEVLQPININLSYVTMSPVNNTIFDRLLTGIGGKYECTKTSGRTDLTETNKCKNYAFISQESDEIVAFRHSDIRNSLLYDELEKADYANFIDHRDVDLVKHYINVFNPNTELSTGYEYRWQGDFAIGIINNIYN